jgi:hypothetical protein
MKYVKTNALNALLTVSLMFGGAWICSDASAAPRQNASTVTTTRVYEAGSSEGASIYAWIRDKSPEYSPFATGTEISVTTTTVSSDKATVAALPSPPVPLPASGTPGQTITIMSTFANGGFESWTYTWNSRTAGGGSWALSGYEYKKGNLNIQ